MSADSVDQVFEKAISTIHTLSSLKGYNSLPRPPAGIRTELYALFKQSTEGDVDLVLPRPIAGPDLQEYSVALRKWEAWKTKTGLSKTEAKKQYIQMLISTMRSYATGTLAARELLADLEFLWSQVAHENVADNETASMAMAIQDEQQDYKSLRLRREIYETLFALNESKANSSHDLDAQNKRLKGDPNRGVPRIRKILRWITVFVCRKFFDLAKAMIFQGTVLLAALVLAKRLDLLSPLSIDLNIPTNENSCSSKSLRHKALSYIRGGLGAAFEYVNRTLHLNLHHIYISVI
ncbi:LAQU0S14e00188g1_1 [Lachancea quebecensis]|uniref:LAQU0S14e00188g1_1 n=1 Tax=Lachancea quebecensis TaxID=1654605 RepID=A0A0P1KXL3_9SACH|nr:LAQU0S14e00188g1_1 [Lachancea quebecensis]